MATTLKAPYDGADYQARIFWNQALRLLAESSVVAAVEYECRGAKSIDDVAVFYTTPINEAATLIDCDYYQVKFHTKQKPFGYEDLMSPAFINAEKFSFLERLRDCYREQQKRGRSCRFFLSSPSPVNGDDALAQLIKNDAGGLDVETLMTKGPRSEIGKVREAWRKHLGVDADELKGIMASLRIQNPGQLEYQKTLLGLRLKLAGVKEPDATTLANVYDDLARKMVQAKLTKFDAAGLKEFLVREKLWNGGPQIAKGGLKRIGIRSFIPFADSLGEQTEEMLCLQSYFKDRHIIAPGGWAEVYPALSEFVRKSISRENRNCFILHTHTSIAFAAGYATAKSGAVCSIEQGGFGGAPPSEMVIEVPGNSSKRGDWGHEVQEIDSSATDIVIAISATRPALAAATAHIETAKLPVNRIVHVQPTSGPSQRSIEDGTHAGEVAELVSKVVADLRGAVKPGAAVHFFISGPNVLSFALGELDGI